MNRNGYREEKACCYFHPGQVVVGVCPLCLNERLLIVAAKQRRHHHHRHNRPSSASKASSHNRLQSFAHRKPPSSIHKIFAFGSLFSRQESQQWKSAINYEYDVSSSPEDSFISIKFEENGIASWEKSTVSKVSLENRNNMSKKNHHGLISNKDTNNNTYTNTQETKSVVEHGKSGDTFRWRKRIGHMFHPMRWKRTGGVCHVGTKVEGVKVRKGNWIRTLTKRKNSVE